MLESFPTPHRVFTETLIDRSRRDGRFLGLAVAGSALEGRMDEFSDLDFVLVVRDDRYDGMLEDREAFAGSLGELRAAFTGEHVGEPRLLICLYSAPLLHVDLKFVRLGDFASGRVDDPAVLWEERTVLGDAIRANPGHYPRIAPQWVEDRFWVWVHYTAAKIGRGERFEAIDALNYMRVMALAPVAKVKKGLLQRGVRWLEQELPERVEDFRSTLPASDRPEELFRALGATAAVYRKLREGIDGLIVRQRAEAVAGAYLEELKARWGVRS